jgi:hypothetical protein
MCCMDIILFFWLVLSISFVWFFIFVFFFQQNPTTCTWTINSYFCLLLLCLIISLVEKINGDFSTKVLRPDFEVLFFFFFSFVALTDTLPHLLWREVVYDDQNRNCVHAGIAHADLVGLCIVLIP